MPIAVTPVISLTISINVSLSLVQAKALSGFLTAHQNEGIDVFTKNLGNKQTADAEYADLTTGILRAIEEATRKQMAHYEAMNSVAANLKTEAISSVLNKSK